jgi:hypothetical protein
MQSNEKTLKLVVTDAAQFVRNGNTRFVLTGTPLPAPAPGGERTVMLTILAEDSTEEACETLALACAGDEVTLTYQEEEQVGRAVCRCLEVTIQKSYPLLRRPV